GVVNADGEGQTVVLKALPYSRRPGRQDFDTYSTVERIVCPRQLGNCGIGGNIRRDDQEQSEFVVGLRRRTGGLRRRARLQKVAQPGVESFVQLRLGERAASGPDAL